MKIKEWIKSQFSFSIQEIAFTGIITALWIVSDRFLTIDFGIMRTGIVFVWAILLGLTTKPILGVTVAIIANTITTTMDVGLGMWMWEYAIIYPCIVLLSSFLKHTFKTKNNITWWSLIIFINGIALIGAFIISIYKNDFINVSRDSDASFDFTKNISKAIIWVCMFIMFAMFLTLVVLTTRNGKYKTYLTIYSISAAAIVLFIWVWGPIAQIRYLTRLHGTQKDGSSYWNLYDVYLTARILKTPIILPLYTIIIASVYLAYQQVEKHSSKHHKW